MYNFFFSLCTHIYLYMYIYNIYRYIKPSQESLFRHCLGQGGGRAAIDSRFAAPAGGGRQRVAVRGAVERGAGTGGTAAGGGTGRTVGWGTGTGQGGGGGGQRGGAVGFVADRLALRGAAGVGALGGGRLGQLEPFAGGLDAVFQRQGPVLQAGEGETHGTRQPVAPRAGMAPACTASPAARGGSMAGCRPPAVLPALEKGGEKQVQPPRPPKKITPGTNTLVRRGHSGV